MRSKSLARPRAPVLVLAAIAVTALIGQPTQAQAYTGVYIFGDSLSDSGNNALATAALTGFPNGVPQAVIDNTYVPSFPYLPQAGWNNAAGFATYSNGNTWATSFAAQLGTSALPSLAGGTNYAFGGARTLADGTPGNFPPSLNTQVSAALFNEGGMLDGDALYVVAGGGNNARDVLSQITPASTLPEIVTLFSQASAQFAIDIGNIVDRLQGAGAEDIVVWNVPNLGLVPAVTEEGAQAAGLGSLLAFNMNSALNYRLQGEAGVTTFDVFSLVTAADMNPVAFGLVNTDDACGAVINACDPATALFWDGIHPTAAGHQLLAGAMLAQVVPEPGTVWMMMAGLVGFGALVRRRRD